MKARPTSRVAGHSDYLSLEEWVGFAPWTTLEEGVERFAASYRIWVHFHTILAHLDMHSSTRENSFNSLGRTQ